MDRATQLKEAFKLDRRPPAFISAGL